VVAEEVRNLAQRSAEAAKNTANLIEGSQKNAENGVIVSVEVGKSLEQISERVQKVAQLIGEVSAASQEQSQGIDQVNTAVAQMDKVTQSNAANAEESASASEELSGQAQNLNAMVNQLMGIVGGKVDSGFGIAQQSFGQTHAAAGVHAGVRHVVQTQSAGKRNQGLLQHDMHGKFGADQHKGNARTAEKPLALAHAKEVHPEQIIPLEDDTELKQF
jgi:methyl-accepting chemotaxis protein